MNEVEVTASWVGNILIVAGMWQLSGKYTNPNGFLLTATGNFAWMAVALSGRNWALAVLCAVLAGISARGFFRWLSTERKNVGKNVCVSKSHADNVRYAIQHRRSKRYIAYCSTTGEPILVNDVSRAETWPTAGLAHAEMRNCHPFWALRDSVFEVVIATQL